MQRSSAELDAIRAAAHAAAAILDELIRSCAPGVTTAEIDALAAHAIRARGADGLFHGYVQEDAPPFPGDSCISINDEVVHGVPGPRRLHPGDLVCIDIGIRLDGWCADMARAVILPHAGVDRPHANLEALVRIVRRSIQLVAEHARSGARWSTIAQAQEALARSSGFNIVTEFVGHAIGRDLHEPPKVPSYRTGFTGDDFVLEPGMVLAVEPILTLPRDSSAPSGSGVETSRAPHGPSPEWRTPTRLDRDGWTVRTVDGSIACHEERMILITPTGAEILGGPLAELNP